MSDYVLYLGDCLEQMSQIEDGSVDCIIADLPYGQTNCSWDVVIPFEPLWAHYKRVIKKRGAVVLFGTFPFTALLWASNPEWYKDELIWQKTKATRYLDAQRRPLKDHENIIVFCEGQTTYNPQKEFVGIKDKRKIFTQKLGQSIYHNHISFSHSKDDGYRFPRTIIRVGNNDTTKQLHPTQKPVALLEYLILTYTNPGELVLDNTMGSGSTGVACMNLGRRFIGIELLEEYFNIAQARIANAVEERRRQPYLQGFPAENDNVCTR